MKKIQIIIIGAIIIFGALSINAATWTVTKTANSNDGVCDSDCSLREAVASADSGDLVVFDPNIAGITFQLGGTEIVVTKRISIDGQLSATVAQISGGLTSQIFRIIPGAALDLRNAVLTGGNGESTFISCNGVGGAICSQPNGNLSLDRVVLVGNRAMFDGAILLQDGTHSITNSTIMNNSAEKSASAVGFNGNANVYMANVTFSNNRIPVIDPNFSGCGAICGSGRLTIRNSTITNNRARRGGGIFLTNNSSAVFDLGNTIVAGNSATESGPDIFYSNSATITSSGGNLVQDPDTVPAGIFNQTNDETGANPLFAPLTPNQGGDHILMHPLQAGSHAYNTGINALAVDPLTNQPLQFDARGAGFPRIASGTVDKGAFEDQTNNSTLFVTKTANSDDQVCDLDCSLREAVYQASVHTGTDTITFNNLATHLLGGTEILIENHDVNFYGQNASPFGVSVSGENVNRIFRINNAMVKIEGLKLFKGNSGIDFGGAIKAQNSNLTLERVYLGENRAPAYGAMQVTGGTTRIRNSSISNNLANTVLAFGGSGTFYVSNTTVSSNLDADGGGGIGAIYFNGAAFVRNSTVAFNRTSGGTGGGIYSDNNLNIGNSIISNNIALNSPDIHRNTNTITSAGGNIILSVSGFPAGTFSQSGDTIGIDPLLEPLNYFFSVAPVHPLQTGSPALNSGLNSLVVDPFDDSVLTTDGRALLVYPRIQQVTVDKGAFEVSSPTAALVPVGGRVLSGKQGLQNAQVILTDEQGISKTAKTTAFGYFRFEDVEAGQTYVLTVNSKRFQFTPQVLSVNEEMTGLVINSLE